MNMCRKPRLYLCKDNVFDPLLMTKYLTRIQVEMIYDGLSKSFDNLSKYEGGCHWSQGNIRGTVIGLL